MNKHYHMLMGMEGGYMPDVNHVCKTKQDASDSAQWQADQFRQDWDIKYSVTGNKRNGYYIIEKNTPGYRLGTIIDITICFELDCLEL